MTDTMSNKNQDKEDNWLLSTGKIAISYHPILENDTVSKLWVKYEVVFLGDFPDYVFKVNACGKLRRERLKTVDEKIGFILSEKLDKLQTEPFRQSPLNYPDKLIGRDEHKHCFRNGYFVAYADRI